MPATKLSTNQTKVILASASQIRKQMIKKHFKNIIFKDHLVNEEKIKNQIKSPKQLVSTLAREKVISIKHLFTKEIIIGADQILVCNEKIFSKPKDLGEAKQNLLVLKNKTHILLSSIYVMKDNKFYFKKTKKAELFFKDISISKIEHYMKTNHKTVLSTVGSYKIEDNDKYNFLKIVSGDMETILGFPIANFIRKINEEK